MTIDDGGFLMTLQEYTRFLAQNQKVVYLDDVPWLCSNRRLSPVVPPHVPIKVDRDIVKGALKSTGALVAVWNESWDVEEGLWWCIACDDKNYGMDSISSKNRRKHTKRGLSNCEIRRLSTDEFARDGYAVHRASRAAYRENAEDVSEERFQKDLRRNAEYPGRETWGAFYDDALIAYVSCVVVDDCVYRMSSKSIPQMRMHNPNEALVFATTSHFMLERQMACIVSGWRVLDHPTNIQSFMIDMGFRRVYCPLCCEFSPLARVLLSTRIHRWGKFALVDYIAPSIMRGTRALARLADVVKGIDPELVVGQ